MQVSVLQHLADIYFYPTTMINISWVVIKSVIIQS